MGTVLDLQGVMSEVDVHREAKSAIGRTAEQFIDLNREQLLEGRRADGTVMPDYSYASVKYYGKPAGPIMLFDTGEFHSSMKLDVGATDTEVLAVDKYGLEERFGDEIYGLMPGSQEYYNQEVFFPEFSGSIEKITGLEFK